MRGKLIVVEGTDCSGKETQTNLLVSRLKQDGHSVERLSFPMYETSTGRIIGGPLLGKPMIGEGFFAEGAVSVEAKVASLYYAADRRYNMSKITNLLEKGVTVILDRYVQSNMAHQGGKIGSSKERHSLYDWIDKLEFQMLELPRPDKIFLLYLPYKNSIELRKKRKELPDQAEAKEDHLRNSEAAYLELANLYDYGVVSCVKNGKTLSIPDIHEKLYKEVKKEFINGL